jgi:acyl dehydratase
MSKATPSKSSQRGPVRDRVDLYLDELKPGDRFESHGYTLTEADVIDFARNYDPQPFHIDIEAAKQTIHGGLIASGFQTLAVGFRMLYQTGFITSANLGGVGLDELRWLKPVRPGDTLRSTGEMLALTPSKSKPDRGVAKYLFTVLNQRDEPVLSGTFVIILKRKRD